MHKWKQTKDSPVTVIEELTPIQWLPFLLRVLYFLICLVLALNSLMYLFSCPTLLWGKKQPSFKLIWPDLSWRWLLVSWFYVLLSRKDVWSSGQWWLNRLHASLSPPGQPSDPVYLVGRSGQHLDVGCWGPAWGTPPMAKVMRKEAWHTQRRDRASGVPLEILKHLPP